jgi:cytoskeleton protein RodZ
MEVDMQEQNQSLGEILRQSRESKKLSIQQVAERLRLSVAKIQAIESDDVELLRTDLARGYIRNYAKLLGTDAQILLDLHSQAYPQQQQQIFIATEALQKKADQYRALRKNLLIVFVLMVSISLIGIGAYHGVTYLAEHQSMPVSNKASAENEAATEKQILDKEQVAAEVNAQADKQESVNANTNANGPMQQGQIELKLVFTEQSWTSVRDIEGRSIYNKLAEAGTQDLVYGFPPLKLIVGNVHGTKVYAHGSEISLDKYMQNNVARLNVE